MEKIDVSDLPEEEAELIQELVELLKGKAILTRPRPVFPEKIEFSAWPLGVKGKLTRADFISALTKGAYKMPPYKLQILSQRF